MYVTFTCYTPWCCVATMGRDMSCLTLLLLRCHFVFSPTHSCMQDEYKTVSAGPSLPPLILLHP